MYIPPLHKEDDPTILYGIMRENGFALLISNDENGPTATHLPMMLETDDDGGASLTGHMAREHRHLDILAKAPNALAVFSGPHAYVSPSWYETSLAVPTWNYVAVHAYGNVSLIEAPAEQVPMMAELVHQYEDGRGTSWRMEDLPDDFMAQKLKGIVGFRMQITRLEGKLKLSQNQSPADAARVADALANGSPADQATAHAMRIYGVAGGAA